MATDPHTTDQHGETATTEVLGANGTPGQSGTPAQTSTPGQSGTPAYDGAFEQSVEPTHGFAPGQAPAPAPGAAYAAPPQAPTYAAPSQAPVYAAPGARPGQPAPGKNSYGFGIASFVIGIASIVSGWTVIAPVVGLVLGIIALRRNTTERTLTLWGVWLNGIMLGIAAIGLMVLFGFIALGVFSGAVGALAL